MFCPKCGTQLNDSAAFCNACGAKVGGGASAKPSIDFLASKKVGVKDFNFLFVAIAGILAFFATTLMSCPVISMGTGEMTTQLTLLACGQSVEGDGNAVGQVIFTILTFISLAYLFVPYIKVKGFAIQATALNYAVPAVILTAQSLFFLIACIINPLGEEFKMMKEFYEDASLGLSMDGWLYWLCALVSIGLLVWETLKFFADSKKK